MTDTETKDAFDAHTVVWAEIPVTDMARATAFYSAVLEKPLVPDDSGPNPMAFLPAANDASVSGHIYPGTPAPTGTGSTIHLGVNGSLEAAMDRVSKAGGTVLSEPITIPFGRFTYCADPDGNSIGLFSA
ncbi:MAG: VOC family protein [Pseudomonadota bacterium]